MDGLQVGFERIVVVVGELMVGNKTGIDHRTDIKRVGLPVISGIENISARHFKDRYSLFRYSLELFCHHILCHLFDVIACQTGSISGNMVTDFLFRIFQHHLVCATHAVVIDHGKILVFNQQVITLVLERRGKGILLIDTVSVIILFGSLEQSFIITLVPKFVQPGSVIG